MRTAEKHMNVSESESVGDENCRETHERQVKLKVLMCNWREY